MAGEYILKGKTPVRCDSVMEWAEWFHKANRKVATDTVGDVTVSTVFLALDHNYGSDGSPVLFETMVFGGVHDQMCRRYSTWDEAAEGHKVACLEVFGDPDKMKEKIKEYAEKSLVDGVVDQILEE